MKIFFSLILILIFLGSLTFISLGEKDSEPEMDIYLVANDIHIGLMLPVKNKVFDWSPFIVDGYFEHPSDPEWIEFGWGDRRFYFEMPTWDKFTLGLALDALFLPDPAIMHVGIEHASPQESKYVTRVKISYKTYEKLVASLKSWVVMKEGKPILIPGKGYSQKDQFFEAKGSYSLIRTCNVWTAGVLADAGLKHPVWSPTKYGLEFMWSL